MTTYSYTVVGLIFASIATISGILWGALEKYKTLSMIICILSTIISLWAGIKAINNPTAHEKFMDNKYITGILAPFNSKYGKIYIQGGGFTFDGHINDTVIPFIGCSTPPPDNKPDNESLTFTLKENNGVFLLSIIIKDLMTGEIITQIRDNKFLITKGISDYHSDKNCLEIIDKYGYVAFQMWVGKSDMVQMRGYFYGKYCTLFANNDNVADFIPHDDPNYIRKAREEVDKLKPIFKYQ